MDNSSDLTIPDFLWGYLKNKVYSHQFSTIQELQQTIQFVVNEINKDLVLLLNIYHSLRRRIDICIEKNGQILDI